MSNEGVTIQITEIPFHQNKENALAWLATYKMWHGLKWMAQQILVQVFLSVILVTEWTSTFHLVEIICDLIEN